MLKIATLTSLVDCNEELRDLSTVRIPPHPDLSHSFFSFSPLSAFFLLSSLLRTLFSVKLGGRDESRVRIPPRNRRHRCLSPSSNVLTLNILYPRACLFGDGSSLRHICCNLSNHSLHLAAHRQQKFRNFEESARCNRGSSKKKKISIKIQLSEGIATNPFLQQSILSNVETNPFLSFYGNRSQFSVVPRNIFLPQENNFSSSATWINSNNPFLNIGTDIRVDTESSVAPESVTQTPYRPLPSAPVINTPSTLYTPAPANNPFITSHTHNPSIKVEPPSLSTPSLSDIKIGPTKTKSELKCEEYVRELVGTTEIMSLVGTSPDVIKVDNVCRDANRLIVGGTEAKPGEFPHMVALGRRNSNETFTLICGATLISHTWVLSAAHCTYGPNGGPTDARIGFHRLTDQQPGVTIAIKTMIRHPDYNPPAMYADIALVQLMNAVTFSTSIRPACLYVQYDTGPMNAWISGWGVTEFAGEQTDRLQKAQLDLVDNLACTIRHNSSKEVPYGVTPSMVCAGDPHGGWTKDSCQGDSGGPLQIIHPKNLCFFQVIGITSFGQGCAIIDAPGVYTRVSHYISYIENIVWP